TRLYDRGFSARPHPAAAVQVGHEDPVARCHRHARAVLHDRNRPSRLGPRAGHAPTARHALGFSRSRVFVRSLESTSFLCARLSRSSRRVHCEIDKEVGIQRHLYPRPKIDIAALVKRAAGKRASERDDRWGKAIRDLDPNTFAKFGNGHVISGFTPPRASERPSMREGSVSRPFDHGKVTSRGDVKTRLWPLSSRTA